MTVIDVFAGVALALWVMMDLVALGIYIGLPDHEKKGFKILWLVLWGPVLIGGILCRIAFPLDRDAETKE